MEQERLSDVILRSKVGYPKIQRAHPSPSDAHMPRKRERFVLTLVSSMKTTRSGFLAIAGGIRGLNQFSRFWFTRARLRSLATNEFLMRISQALEHYRVARMMHL